jgi:hypothetical protein
MSKIIYLASPYSHPDSMVRKQRYDQVTKYAAKQIAAGNIVFSPITYGHIMTEFETLPTNFEFWENFCFSFLSKCDEMHILKIEGWEISNGIDMEEQFCYVNNIPIKYIDYEKE